MSFFEGFGRIIFYTGIFVAGYSVSGCVREDPRYDVVRYEEKPYLVDKNLSKKVEIKNDNGNLQLGDLEYRVECVLEDRRLLRCLSTLKERWENDNGK
ncbi:hypothetical protein HOM13_03380 [Candidatus Woesearchaeota archaeon]|jgi:hypothetical protein|nr:hypothetical protein [Candidatus Woesearchaeota archaeon]MBT5215751.1 hypothetical protein [Candidatus Woesearchaeota archaeon]MBT6402578.1 hypothetical protein [Candidatus Woesearchaeota archaeon]